MKSFSAQVKETALSLGCNLCGIASIDRFSNLPSISDPQKILPGAQSVIVIAKKFLQSTLTATSTIPYTIIRNYLSRKIDEITIQLSYFLDENGYTAIPTGAIEPSNYSSEISKSVGLISLKNAAYHAGLGVIGKNTLLITPQFGNLVWLGAVITTAELEPDDMLTKSPCNENCRKCINACPVKAIDGGIFMDQKKCWHHAFGETEDGEWRIKCYKCREICSYVNGYE